MRIPGRPALAVTALNFSHHAAREQVDLRKIKRLQAQAFADQTVFNAIGGQAEGQVSSQGLMDIALQACSGKTLIIYSP
jgi:hypothetical protein